MSVQRIIGGHHLGPATTSSAPRRYTITLPAGLKLLNANDRPHHTKRAEITRGLRIATVLAIAKTTALAADLKAAKPGPLLERAHILGVLHPPTNGRRDPANWYPSFKAAVDGLIDAGLLEDDDHTHVLGPDMRLGPKAKGGQIVLHVLELEPGTQWPELPEQVAS